MASLLFALGGAIITLLGTLHGLYTWRDAQRPKMLAPRDPDLIEAMRAARLGLTAETNLWRAWIGFNFSHSLGAAVFGGGLVIIAFAYPAALSEPPVRVGAPLVAALYLLMSVKYWFSIPTMGIGVALVLMILGAALI